MTFPFAYAGFSTGIPIAQSGYLGSDSASSPGATRNYVLPSSTPDPDRSFLIFVITGAAIRRSVTGITVDGVPATSITSTIYNGSTDVTLHAYVLQVPNGNTPTVVVTFNAAPSFSYIAVHTVYGAGGVEYAAVAPATTTSTTIALNNCPTKNGGYVAAFFGCATTGPTFTEAWSGTPSPSEDFDANTADNNHSIGGCHFSPDADSLTHDLTITISSSQASAGIIVSFSPVAMTAIDHLFPTGAWSMSRNLLSAYGGSLYADTSGAITTFYDQSGSARNATDGGTAARRPAVSTAGPNSRACADFDGSSDYLEGSDMDNHVLVGTAYIILSAIFDVISEAVTVNFATVGHTPISDASGKLGVYACNDAGTDKIYAANYVSGASDTRTSQNGTEGTAYVIELRHESGTLYLRINGGTETSIASGNTSANLGNLRMGYRGNAYFDGKLFEMATFNTIPSSNQRDKLMAMFKSHVGA